RKRAHFDLVNYALNLLETPRKGRNAWSSWKHISDVKSSICGKNEGSVFFWHALMHRREPDYGNSKYWFRRVPQHPIFDDLCKQAAALAEQAAIPQGGEFLTRQRTRGAAAFVDLCEIAAEQGGTLEHVCRQIQRCEWELLFLFCHDRAFGRA